MSLLKWTGTEGVAEHDGVRVLLADAPPLADDVKDIVFVPGIVNVIRCGDKALRSMTQEEADAATKMLVQMSSDARDALDGGSTLAVVFGK